MENILEEQPKTARINYEVPSSVLIKNLNWMTIRERYVYFLGISMYKFTHELLPPSFNNQFCHVKTSHTYNTRAALSNQLSLPLPHTQLLLKTNLLCLGPKLWNSLPNERDSYNIYMFKQQYKSYINTLDVYSI